LHERAILAQYTVMKEELSPAVAREMKSGAVLGNAHAVLQALPCRHGWLQHQIIQNKLMLRLAPSTIGIPAPIIIQSEQLPSQAFRRMPQDLLTRTH
jgi:hypothetical protein